jgi:hypothetical protein
MHSFVRKYPRYVLAGWSEGANVLYIVPALRPAEFAQRSSSAPLS